MQFRKLGNTGIDVSVIGFGGWEIGGRTEGLTSYGDTNDEISLSALERALERGMTFFDTAPAYGSGHSEELFGRTFLNRRDSVVIATKVGYADWTKEPDFRPEAILASVEGSLRRLQTDYIDLLQLHNAPYELLAKHPEIIGCLVELQEQGKIRAWGMSVKSPEEGILAITNLKAKVLQLNLNMLDTRAVESGLTELAKEYEVGLIARTPLCFGFLSGAVSMETKFPAGDHRNAWPSEQLEHWIKGAETLFNAISESATGKRYQTALQFCLAVPGVAIVLPGMLTPEEADQNADVGDCPPLSRVDYNEIIKLNQEIDFFKPKK